MDKNTKKSLLFGAVVGGLFALGRNAGEKQKLTPGQLKDVDALGAAFVQLQNAASDRSISDTGKLIAEKGPEKKYSDILAYLVVRIHAQEDYLAVIDNFKNRLDQVLSTRFTAERANAKTHEVQSQFSSLAPLPDRMEEFINKRIQILRHIQHMYLYISNGEAEKSKPEDDAALQTLVGEYQALELRTTGLLKNVTL